MIKKLLCFDFDQTIVKGHFHNILAAYKQLPADPKIIDSLIKHEDFGPKNPAELRECLSTALIQGHYIAVTSYTCFPEVVVPTLRAIGLNEEEIKSIHCECFLPKDQSVGKIPHLENAMAFFKFFNCSDVCLVDDSHYNCQSALKNGFQAILVGDDLKYFDQINQFLW